jgi:hypothetical protein
MKGRLLKPVNFLHKSDSWQNCFSEFFSFILIRKAVASNLVYVFSSSVINKETFQNLLSWVAIQESLDCKSYQCGANFLCRKFMKTILKAST